MKVVEDISGEILTTSEIEMFGKDRSLDRSTWHLRFDGQTRKKPFSDAEQFALFDDGGREGGRWFPVTVKKASLRDQIIRLAFENPELRGELLPLLKKARSQSDLKSLRGKLYSVLSEEARWHVITDDERDDLMSVIDKYISRLR